MAKVSVCLPVFNGRRYLRAAIETVLAQTHRDLQLLIADDCSTDDSFEIIQELAKRDNRIVAWQNKTRLGLFQNYNACIERTEGDYIKLFAQDDLLVPTNLERHLEIYAENPQVALITGARNIINDWGEFKERLSEFQEDKLIDGEEVIESNLTQYCNWVGEPTCVSFPAKWKGTGFDTTLFHYGDIEYWFRIVENGQMFFASEAICSFRRHEGSATRRNMRSMNFIYDLAYMGDKYRDFLEKRGISKAKYWEKMIETISPWVYAMVDDEGLKEPDSSDLGPESTYDAELLKSLLAVMRHTSLVALHKLTMENRRNASLARDLENELFSTEEKLSNVLNSPAIKASSAVRSVLTRLASAR